MAAVLFVTVLVVTATTVAGNSPKLRDMDDDWGSCLHSNSAVCNDRGRCVCGQCQCEENYYGPQCQHFKYAINCLTVKSCVQCTVFNSGPLDREQCATQCHTSIEIVDQLDEGQMACRFVDTDHCLFTFNLIYSDDDPGHVHLKVLHTKECP